jgi:hypothetical protein
MTQSNTAQHLGWKPIPNLVSHAGQPLSLDVNFFMPPPPTIGALISAHTTLTASSAYPIPPLLRWIAIGFSSLLVAIAIVLVVQNLLFAVVAAAIVGALIWFVTQYHHTCSYVGSEGAISYELIDSRTAIPKEHLLLFADAHSLYAKTTRNYYNSIYTCTNYIYTWKKHTGTEHIISGRYRSEKNPPPPADSWHFANLAESAWSSYLLANLDREIANNGYAEFSLATTLKSVRIGKGFMEFVTRKDDTQRVLVADMRDISLGCGTFQFKHQDAKWWSGKGKYSFEYANIPNARVFLICLNELAGISWN